MSQDAKSLIYHSWGTGASGYGDQNDSNLKRISRVGFQLSVIDRDLATPPVSPADGDTYIIAAAGTGDWLAHDGDVAYYDGSLWAFYPPEVGWVAYLEDEEKLTVYKSGGWSAGIAI